jgi:hyperosmotically inducible periplasmic protein
MNSKLLAILVTAGALAIPAAAYSQGTTPPKKDSAGMGTTSQGTKGGDSPDAIITGKIKAKFMKDKVVRSRSYNVDTDKGVVVVRGTARSQAEADRAMELAKGTEGVTSVRNEIKVQASADRPKRDSSASAPKAKRGSPDAVITGKVKSQYIKDKMVRARSYNVDTDKGVVTVRGTARSQAEADRAMEIAKNTQGVTSVRNEIKVQAAADKPRRDSTATTKRDSTATTKSDAAKGGPAAAATGTVSEPTKGTGATIDDAVITTKIKTEYAKDKTVSAMRIKVDTNKGVTTLSGTARSKEEADKAVALAKNVQGVTSVKNEIKIEPK